MIEAAMEINSLPAQSGIIKPGGKGSKNPRTFQNYSSAGRSRHRSVTGKPAPQTFSNKSPSLIAENEIKKNLSVRRISGKCKLPGYFIAAESAKGSSWSLSKMSINMARGEAIP